jgi:predicted nucleic acid-binding protein
VVDASALAALLFGEPEAEVVAERLGEARLVAPALIGFELANVCLIKSRRHPEKRAMLTAAFKLRGKLTLEEIAVDQDETLELATATGLTAYDASYLWLARQLGAELVTLDSQLAKAESALLPK